MERPLLLLALALVPPAVGLVLISVVIGSKKLGRERKRTLPCAFSALMTVAGALIVASQLV